MKLFLDDGNEDIGGYGAPDLGLHRILAGAEELLDSQMLLDPFEEQFHLPAAFVNLRDRQRGEQEIVGEELEPPVVFGIERGAAPQRIGIPLGRTDGGQDDGVIGSQTGGFVDRARGAAFEQHVLFAAYDQEGGAGRGSSSPRRTDFDPDRRPSDRGRLKAARCRSALGRNPRRCAHRATRWHRPGSSAPRDRETP